MSLTLDRYHQGRAQCQGLVFALIITVSAVANAGTVELIADPQFRFGLSAKEFTLPLERKLKPAWSIAQHYSKSDFSSQASSEADAPSVTFQDAYQLLHINSGDINGDLVLGVNGLKEHGGRYRIEGDTWPHLYVSQRISAPNGHLGAASPSLVEVEELDLRMSVKLEKDDMNKGKGYDPSLHAAQYVFF